MTDVQPAQPYIYEDAIPWEGSPSDDEDDVVVKKAPHDPTYETFANKDAGETDDPLGSIPEESGKPEDESMTKEIMAFFKDTDFDENSKKEEQKGVKSEGDAKEKSPDAEAKKTENRVSFADSGYGDDTEKQSGKGTAQGTKKDAKTPTKSKAAAPAPPHQSRAEPKAKVTPKKLQKPEKERKKEPETEAVNPTVTESPEKAKGAEVISEAEVTTEENVAVCHTIAPRDSDVDSRLDRLAELYICGIPKVVKILGLVAIVLGALSILFQVEAIAFRTTHSNVSSGVWGGIVFIVTGAFAIYTEQKSIFHNVLIMCILAGASAILSVIFLAVSVVGLISDSNPPKLDFLGVSLKDQRVAHGVLLFILALCQLGISVWLTFICYFNMRSQPVATKSPDVEAGSEETESKPAEPSSSDAESKPGEPSSKEEESKPEEPVSKEESKTGESSPKEEETKPVEPSSPEVESKSDEEPSTPKAESEPVEPTGSGSESKQVAPSKSEEESKDTESPDEESK